MYVTFGEEGKHAEKLKRGLAVLGPEFYAYLCWWCEGTTRRKFEGCDICGKGKPYGCALGLLMGDSVPAPTSVVNQVLVAAEKELV